MLGDPSFFTPLPPDDFLPWEAALRAALLDALHTVRGPIPLLEWIDNRIGEEVETRQMRGGGAQILLRGGWPSEIHASARPPPVPPSLPLLRIKQEAQHDDKDKETLAVHREYTVAGLPLDCFTPEEDRLRGAAFDFTAAQGDTEEPMVLARLGEDADIPQPSMALLPKSGTLFEGWVGEQLCEKVRLEPGQSDHDLVPAAADSRAASGQATRVQQASADSEEPLGRAATYENFFSNLPPDELLPLEVTLRDAIVELVHRWPQRRPESRPADSMPVINDLMREPKIAACRSQLLPPKVKLRAWIKRRIGDSIELRKVAGRADYEQVLARGSVAPSEPVYFGAGP